MSNRDTSYASMLARRRNLILATYNANNTRVYSPHPISHGLYLQSQLGKTPEYTKTATSESVSEPCGCASQTSSTLCDPNSLNTIAEYLRNYMTEFRNLNFYPYRCDGDLSGHYIGDGEGDMYDTGNFTTPWLLSGNEYTLTSTDLEDYPHAVPYTNTTQIVTDTDFNYVSLGHIYQESTEEDLVQIDQSRLPLTVLGYRCSGPVGWQIGGELGADDDGTVISNMFYNNVTVNGFQVYAGYRQVYDAGDPTVCNLIILLGHPSWNSVFGSVTLSIDEDDDGGEYNQIYMHSGEGSQNILAIHTLLSKPANDDSTPIPNEELETVVANFTLRIGEAMGM